MVVAKKLGFHFYEDAHHYTRCYWDDWHTHTGQTSNWICLKSSFAKAIPDIILKACQENQIQVLLQFDLMEWCSSSLGDREKLLNHYQRQGIRYVQLDGYINQRATWKGISNNGPLLHQISQTVIDFHKVAFNNGFLHVLPALFPGGDLWDLVVLRYLFQEFQANEIQPKQLVMSFAAWVNGHSLTWGMGGKRKWTQPQPYQDIFSGQDHRGFMGFEWYQELALEEFGKKLPIILLEAGKDVLKQGQSAYSAFINEFIDLIQKENQRHSFNEVIGICLAWHENWIDEDISGMLTTCFEKTSIDKNIENFSRSLKPHIEVEKSKKVINHYLLLPCYEWGISPWHLEVALPYIRKFQPTIGYSVEEAKLAANVTVVMDTDVFPPESIATLRKAGCRLKVVEGDGTEIAAKLAVG